MVVYRSFSLFSLSFISSSSLVLGSCYYLLGFNSIPISTLIMEQGMKSYVRLQRLKIIVEEGVYNAYTINIGSL